MRRGVHVVIAAVTVSAALTGPQVPSAYGRPVLHSRAGEFQPVRSGRYLAWEQNTRSHPDRYKIYARRKSGRRFQVSAPRAEGANGGIDGTRLVFQQFHKGKSDIKLFDLARRRRRGAPKGINTRHWEYWPSISGDWVLFGRLARGGDRKVLLVNLTSGARRVIARTGSKRAFLAPGQVNGQWAAYAKCTPTTKCDVFRYNLASKGTSEVPNPGFYQRAASITPSGTVYFVRARHRCGRSVRVMRHALGNRATAVRRLPDGVDVGDTYVFSRGTRPDKVLYDRRRCGRAVASNIHQLGQPRLLALSTRREGAGGGAIASRPRGIRCGGDCLHSFPAGTDVTLTAHPERNSNFTGWGGACSGSRVTCTTAVGSATSVIAFFDPASSFTLSVAKRGTGRGTVTSTPPGIRCGVDCWEAYRAGTSVRLTASAAAESRFAGWTGACRGTAPCSVTIDRVRSVTATFNRVATASPAVVYPSYSTGHGSAPVAAQ
jgi:Divergent InlB B-repeat domain